MKYHNKTYEDVFSSDRPSSKNKLKLEQVTAGDMDVQQYVSLFQSFLHNFYNDLFLGYVRISWLRRKFTYYGYKTVLPMPKNHIRLNHAFTKLLRRFVGKDLQIITRGMPFSKIESFFDDFFPGFEEGNPFENPDYYRFPFQNITMDFLMVVHQLDDRLELLRYADEKKMSYASFLDYVINHVYCENEDLGRDRYVIRQNQSRYYPFYVRDTDKVLQIRRKRRKTV